MAEFDGLPDDDIWNIDYEDLSIAKELARGSFGKVFKGSYLGVEVAIKQILRHDDPAYIKYIEREISVLKAVRHPFIVGFSGVCMHSSGLYIVTEYVDGGDVRNLLKTGNVSWAKRIQIAGDLAKAVHYLHTKKVIHRDLKSKNLLIGSDQRVRLCDFGFARISDFKVSRAMTICGTPGFVAPEIMMGDEYDASCDIFSYGNVLAELITLMRPGKDFWNRVAENEYEMDLNEIKKFTPRDCPPKFLALCQSCCEYDARKRPDFLQIMKIIKDIEPSVKEEVSSYSRATAKRDEIPNSPKSRGDILSSHRSRIGMDLGDEISYVQCIASQKLQLTPGEIIISEKHVTKLLTRAVNPDVFDSDYLQDFLLFYPCFSTPQQLLDDLLKKFTTAHGTDPASEKKTQLMNIRILVFLKTWTEKYSEDFMEPGMSDLINAFDLASKQSRHAERDKEPPFSISNALSKSKTKSYRSATVLRLKRDSPKKLVEPNHLAAISAIDLARQIALINFSIYRMVHPREFVKETWKRRQDSNIKSLREQCRELSRFVCTAIVNANEKEIRCRLIEKFIDVAQTSLNVKNYNGFFAVVNGLLHPTVDRLTVTFSLIRPQYIQTLKGFRELVSSNNHYKSYKTKQEATLPPCVPYLDVFLEELSFLDSSNPDVGKGGIINFGKHRKMSRLIRHLIQYQETPFAELQPLELIQEMLLNSQLDDDEGLQKKSLLIEPPSRFEI